MLHSFRYCSLKITIFFFFFKAKKHAVIAKIGQHQGSGLSLSFFVTDHPICSPWNASTTAKWPEGKHQKDRVHVTAF